MKIRRRGRHTSPSQVEKVAAQAGKAAPAVDAKSAIILSGDGRNWDAWTTYTSGAYHGRC